MVWFVKQGLVPAWRTLNTDFPNYYLAAKLWRGGFPLDRIYDLIWFQRQKDHAGIDYPQVRYVPLTPFSALVVAPLTSLSALAAKRVWLILNLPLVAATGWWLRRLTRLEWRRVLLIVFLAIVPLRTSFLYGQQHLLVLGLLAFATWCYFDSRPAAAGIAIALAAALKIYPALWVFYLARKRQWRALAALVLTAAALGALALPMFGFETLRTYVVEVLPRTFKGEANDPYWPQFNTWTVLLLRLFVAEPDLNPHPLILAPSLYAVLQPLLQSALLVFGVWLVSPRRLEPLREKLEWAAFATLPFVLSAGSSTYHCVVLILPAALAVAVLAETQRRRDAVLVLALFAICCFPYYRYVPVAPSGWRIFLGFPRLYAIAALWGCLAWMLWRLRPDLGRKAPFAIVLALLVVSGVLSTRRHLRPGGGTRLSPSTPTLVAATPALRRDELYFSRMDDDGYTVDRIGSALPPELPPGIDLFHPTFPTFPAFARGSTDGWVEVASSVSRVSTIARFSPDTPTAGSAALRTEIDDGEDPVASPDGRWVGFLREDRGRAGLWLWDTRANSARAIVDSANDVLDFAFFPDDRIVLAARPDGRPRLFLVDAASGRLDPVPGLSDRPARYPAVSPDGSWLAYAEENGGAWQLWVLGLGSDERRRLTDGDCNAVTPAWLADSKTVVFPSDCARGLGQTALWRIAAVP